MATPSPATTPQHPTPRTQNPRSFAYSNPMPGAAPSESGAQARRVQYVVVPARTPRYIDVPVRYATCRSENTRAARIVAESCSPKVTTPERPRISARCTDSTDFGYYRDGESGIPELGTPASPVCHLQPS